MKSRTKILDNLFKICSDKKWIINNQHQLQSNKNCDIICNNNHFINRHIISIKETSTCNICDDEHRINTATDVAILKSGKLLYAIDNVWGMWECKNNHIFKQSFNVITQKQFYCFTCANGIRENINRKYTFEEVKKDIGINGGELLSTEYINNKTPLSIKCKYGHIFELNFDKIKNKNMWCRDCGTYHTGEEICRNFLEELFGDNFPRYRSDWLRNDQGFKLEFDGFCEKLNIAFEHQGTQHYKVVKYFGKDRFKRLQYNDAQKIKICEEREIKLIVIPQLFAITPLSKFKNIIKQELLRNNITIPLNFDSTEINKIKISKNEYCKNQLELASKLATENNGQLLSTEFIYSHDDLTWKCENNHIFYLSFTGAKQGIWCKYCIFNAKKKDLLTIISKDKLLELYIDKNITITEIVKMYNTSHQKIRALFKEYKLEDILRQKPFFANKEHLYNLYVIQGKSMNAIGKIYGVDHSSIRCALKKNGISR